jgi:YHS domain-containing protein
LVVAVLPEVCDNDSKLWGFVFEIVFNVFWKRSCKMETILKRLLVVCVLVSIVMIAGCKKQEPAVPAEPATSAAPAVPEVVENAAEKAKAAADNAAKDVEADKLIAALKEKLESDADKATKEAEVEKLVIAMQEKMEEAVSEQTKCPVLGGDINKSFFSTYKGKKVYFCCKPCIAKFDAEPEKYISKLPQFKQ